MKLSFSLSAILVVVPALVAASTPLDVRALNGDMYMVSLISSMWPHSDHLFIYLIAP